MCVFVSLSLFLYVSCCELILLPNARVWQMAKSLYVTCVRYFCRMWFGLFYWIQFEYKWVCLWHWHCVYFTVCDRTLVGVALVMFIQPTPNSTDGVNVEWQGFLLICKCVGGVFVFVTWCMTIISFVILIPLFSCWYLPLSYFFFFCFFFILYSFQYFQCHLYCSFVFCSFCQCRSLSTRFSVSLSLWRVKNEQRTTKKEWLTRWKHKYTGKCWSNQAIPHCTVQYIITKHLYT